jgi:RNA polymerase-binding transcription factor DksA
MNTNTSHFNELLLKEKTSLEDEMREIAIFNTETNLWEATPDQDMMHEIDENDAADRFEDFESRSGMINTFQTRLSDINAALAKIESKTYGMCEKGNDHPIEAARLEANPAARTCMEHMNG